MSMADSDVFRVLTTQIRDLERRCVAVAPAKAAIFAFARTDTSAASRGLVQADATIRSGLDSIGRVHSGKVTHVPMVLDSIGVLYEWYLTQEAAVATQIANPSDITEAMARVAIIAPDVDGALNVIARALYLHQPVTRRWFVSPRPAALLLICLIYLVCIAAPVAELELPPELQGLLTNEVGYIALAITVASMVTDHNRRS